MAVVSRETDARVAFALHFEHSHAMWNTGVIALLGIWIIIAPALLPTGASEQWNSRIVGALVFLLVVLVPHSYRWETFAAAAVGASLFISSFLTEWRLDPAARPTDIAAGVLLIVVGTLATRKTRIRVAPKLAP